MAKIQEKYEVLYIVDPRKTEEETAAIIEKFKTLIEENATIDEIEDWGKRHLAYEIDYQTEGYYELVIFLIDHTKEYVHFIMTGKTE